MVFFGEKRGCELRIVKLEWKFVYNIYCRLEKNNVYTCIHTRIEHNQVSVHMYYMGQVIPHKKKPFIDRS
jgi:hypothetical protein